MTPGDLMRRLGMSQAPFYAHQKAGEFRFLEVSRPIGRFRYSRVLVDRFLAGESVVAFGRGSRKARQVSA